jgi:hypothetical protein
LDPSSGSGWETQMVSKRRKKTLGRVHDGGKNAKRIGERRTAKADTDNDAKHRAGDALRGVVFPVPAV